jgi:Domain of unknown function (DUF4349)
VVRTRIGIIWTTALLLVLAFALAACSRDGEVDQGGGGVAVKGGAVEAPEPGAPEEDVSRGVPVEAQSEAPIPQDDFGRKIVKTAQLGISSKDVRGEAARAQQVAARFGGTTLSAQSYRTDNATYADLVISVPSEQFEDALGELRGLGEEVTTDTVSGQDVTEEYVDLQSQERNLLAAEQALLDLYNRADDVQDALSIQRELTTVRGQIEQVHGRLQYLKKSSDTSQISLSLRPVATPPKPLPAWDPALIVAKAWSASLTVLQTLSAAILSTLVFGWWIIPPLVVAAWWLRRRIGRPGFASPAPESSHGDP